MQDALRLLREQGLTISRQGSGVYVRARTERPSGLKPHIELAFEQKHVSIDFAGYTSETLHGVIREPVEKIRTGRLLPDSIALRMLFSDMTVPMALPSGLDTAQDVPVVRERMSEIMHTHSSGIVGLITDLENLGLVKSATVQIRVHSCPPLFKLYVLNNADMFFGFYPVKENTVTYRGEQMTFYDPMGVDATLFHHTVNDDSGSIASRYVQEARTWFESMWETIARDYTP